MAGKSAGRVAAIWRYPVKSMQGEELDEVEITGRGLLGDRAYALVDRETGKVASAKNPRRWPNLFDFRSTFVRPPTQHAALPPARITLPDGQTLTTDQDDAEPWLSAAVGRHVRLARQGFAGASAEGYWPDHDWLPERDTTFAFEFPDGTFFDGAPVHLLTTAALAHLQALRPDSRFDVPRFRPSLVVEPAEGSGFVEEGWIGRDLEIGSAVLRVERPTPRCVMTTLPQRDLPRDPDVLRTAVQANAGNVGVYCRVVRAGVVRRGDTAILA